MKFIMKPNSLNEAYIATRLKALEKRVKELQQTIERAGLEGLNPDTAYEKKPAEQNEPLYKERCPVCGQPVRVAGEGLTHWYEGVYHELINGLLDIKRQLPIKDEATYDRIAGLLRLATDIPPVTIRVPAKQLRELNELLDKANPDYREHHINTNDVLWSDVAVFPNGWKMRLCVESGYLDEPLRTIAQLLDSSGNCCSSMFGGDVTCLDGDWILWDREICYRVVVKADDEA